MAAKINFSFCLFKIFGRQINNIKPFPYIKSLSSSTVSNVDNSDENKNENSDKNKNDTVQLTSYVFDQSLPLTSSLTGTATPLFRTPFKEPLATLPFITPSFMDDPIATKFINCMMWDGKKSLAQSIFRKALEIIKMNQLKEANKTPDKEVTLDPLVIFHEALKNVTPLVGTMKIKKGGKLYHIPVPLNDKRQRFLAIKGLIKAAREREGSRRAKNMPQRLAAEILEAYNHQGSAIKMKKDLHRLAEANRAFAHFRW